MTQPTKNTVGCQVCKVAKRLPSMWVGPFEYRTSSEPNKTMHATKHLFIFHISSCEEEKPFQNDLPSSIGNLQPVSVYVLDAFYHLKSVFKDCILQIHSENGGNAFKPQGLFIFPGSASAIVSGRRATMNNRVNITQGTQFVSSHPSRAVDRLICRTCVACTAE